MRSVIPPEGELYPPDQYSSGWVALAIALVIVVVAAAWLIAALTSPRRAPAMAPRLSLGQREAAIVQLRNEYLHRISSIEGRYLEGSLDARRANLELSRSVRGFVNDYSGLEAPVMTLDDLVRQGVSPYLIDALHRHYYPSVFGRDRVIDPRAGAHAARQVVHAWS